MKLCLALDYRVNLAMCYRPIAAHPATGTGLFFPSFFIHIRNINSNSSSETSSKYLTSTH